jgi:hypothetical protein
MSYGRPGAYSAGLLHNKAADQLAIIATIKPSMKYANLCMSMCLVGPVADQEPEPVGALPQVHQQVPRLLHRPRPVRVRGHAQDMHLAGANFDDKEHIQAAQSHRAVHVKEVAASMVAAWVRRNCRQVVRVRWGAGGIRSCFRIRRIVEAPTQVPRPSSSPWILLYPPLGFFRAICSISAASLAPTGGRPPLRGKVQCQRTSWRCQRTVCPASPAGRSARVSAAAAAARRPWTLMSEPAVPATRLGARTPDTAAVPPQGRDPANPAVNTAGILADQLPTPRFGNLRASTLGTAFI